jgi:hypothetical protein
MSILSGVSKVKLQIYKQVKNLLIKSSFRELRAKNARKHITQHYGLSPSKRQNVPFCCKMISLAGFSIFLRLLAFPFPSFPFTPSLYYNSKTYSMMTKHLDSVNGVKICSLRNEKQFIGLTENTAQMSLVV